MMGLAMLLTFAVNLVLGLPLFFCLLLTAMVGFLFVDIGLFVNILPQRFFGGMDIFSLMAIPLFILAGNLMNNSGMTPRLIRLANAMVGHLRGGLGHVNVVAGVFFAGVNGSAAADASALSSLLVPAMEKEGYSRKFAAGLTAGSSLIGPIIPPSIFMILYSSLTNTSIGELFLAGVVPGLLLALAFMGMNALYARKAGLQARHQAPSWGEVLAAFSGAATALVAPVLIVAGIVMGLVTPTESGALIVLYVAVIGMLQGQLSLRGLWDGLRDTVRLTGSIYAIIAAASVVNWLLNYTQVAAAFAELLGPFSDSPTLILLVISAIIFICGMVMEEVSVLMLLTPIIVPVALAAGVDPVHLGLIFTLNITIAMITPPMGACLFIVAAVSKLNIMEMFKGIWPFVLTALGVLYLLILFPSLTLWLPRLLS
ncbi:MULTISPECIES: TRAP transporter large permease [Pseudomonas]|uniref:TRAP transporter large permease protein n=3 Tax=Gammaproteobacteria TaxID=1236 RepID=A0A653B122_ECTOL|nr:MULTISPECIES: TRAP transporter large permease [Pseudomonas]TNF08224.1 MAG: TRAP transporter large permease [Pseudomonadales bacterium]CAE6948632.1 TRAP-type C4-dicarboxylate transport system, large permease component [Pseudomonas oleovorans]QFT23508.1 Sialic acid TRAP transporter permease protein SiaT [Pseudomonas sp. THAF187a]QFT43696.1 Sialic acid TRAP transporter permease protein SiaT [Pseudomonas sp. THAF42]QTS85417.1 TRAP transporter large permease [Pseudomonas khazarica]